MVLDIKYINEFKKTIKRGDFSQKLDCVLTSETPLDVYCAAIYQGYLDACRTFKSNKLKKDDPRIKELAKKLQDYLHNPNEKFKHEEYCNILIGDNLMTFGQAQKIVNMAFKYLYCIVESDTTSPNYSKALQTKFDECHMPLDGIMLEWLRRNDNTLKKNNIGAWSNISNLSSELDEHGKYTYSFYQDIIKKICQNEKKQPLELDFENWKNMALILVAEEFLKNFDEQDLKKNCSLEELLDRIKLILN